MSCIAEYKKYLREEITKIEELKDQGITITSKGIVLSDLSRRFSNAYTSLSKGVDPSNLLKGIQDRENDILYTSVRRELSSIFKGGFGKNADKDFILEDAKYDDSSREFTLVLKPVIKGIPSSRSYKYTFKRGTDRSLVVRKGSQLYIPNISTVIEKAIKNRDSVLFEVNKTSYRETGNRELEKVKAGISIGSNKGKTDFSKYKKKEEYLHGDIDQMVRVVEELSALDDKNTPEGYISYIKNLFTGMHPHFFYNMDLYIKESNTSSGWVDIDNKNILIRTSKDGNSEKSNAEVYAHEVIHSMTYWALRNSSHPKLSQIKRELNYAIKKAKEKIKWQDYLDTREEDASELAVRRAKELYEYIFSSEYADDEFIAHALTNPRTMELLGKVKLKEVEGKSTSLFEKFSAILNTILDVLVGNYSFSSKDKNIKDQVHALAFRLAEINKKAEVTNDRINLWGKLNNLVDLGEEKLFDKAVAFQEKYFEKDDRVKVPESDSDLAQIKFFGEVVAKSFVNKKYRNLLGMQMSMWAKVGIPTKAGGTLREFMGSFFTSEEYSRSAELFSLSNEHIDTLRNTVIQQTGRNLTKGFKKPLTKSMGKALTRTILDTNMSSLVYSRKDASLKKVYSNKELREILIDDHKRNYRRKKAEDTLKNHLEVLGEGHRFNWVKNQARGLGYFMATHKGNVAQNSSALNIARGVMSKERHKVDKNTLSLIEEVSVLTALQYTDKEYKDIAASIMAEEWEGVNNLMDTFEAFKRDSKEKLFSDDEAHMMDGYTKEVFDNTIEIVNRPMSEKAQLEQEGYKFIGELSPKNGEMRSLKIGQFISESYSRAERFRGAVNLGGNVSKGTDLKEIKFMEDPELVFSSFERDMARIGKEAVRIQAEMYLNNEIDFSKLETGMMPLVDAAGRVVNYRYMMSKKDKEVLLKQETDPIEVLARSMGTVVDKELREEHNEKVLALVKDIMRNNWKNSGVVDGDGVEYSLIGPNSADKEMRELYYMLPRSFQKFILSRKDKVMAVPSELLNIMFGYRHMKVSDYVGKALPRAIVKIIDMFEALWIDMIKIAKGNILLKMPIILITNIVSNAYYLLTATGMSPVELVKAHTESIRSAKEYLTSYRKMNAINIEIGQLRSSLNSSATDKRGILESIKEKEWEIKRLKKEMEQSSIHELFENGLFQSVVEDVNVGILKDNNVLNDKIDSVMDKAPVYIKKALHWAYLSKETPIYRFNQDVLQLSDLVARDVMNKKLKYVEQEIIKGNKKAPKEIREILGITDDKPVVLSGDKLEKFLEISKRGRITELLDTFINYNKPNGRFEEYLNRIGLLMFTKYVKRVQKVIAKTAIKHPIRSIVALLLVMFAIDIDNVQEQAFLIKGFGHNEDFGVTNIFPVYSPLENILNVATPALVKLAT